jgi:hypothetical protein
VKALARILALLLVLGTMILISSPARAAGANTISIDALAPVGVVQPGVTVQMMEWATDSMNEAWAERVKDRSFETERVASARSTLYDGFGQRLPRSGPPRGQPGSDRRP